MTFASEKKRTAEANSYPIFTHEHTAKHSHPKHGKLYCSFFSLFQCLDETENQNEIVFFYSFLKLWDIGSHTCTKPTWIASAITIFFSFLLSSARVSYTRKLHSETKQKNNKCDISGSDNFSNSDSGTLKFISSRLVTKSARVRSVDEYFSLSSLDESWLRHLINGTAVNQSWHFQPVNDYYD